MTQSLTICTVFHNPTSKKLLELNMGFIQKLHPKLKVNWVIADNYLKKTSYQIFNKYHAKVIPGIPVPTDVPKNFIGGYHHAGALNKTLKFPKTRFVLTLDGDLYLVQPNLINQILNYMQQQQLALFGVPWHPKWFNKYRYFPCGHTLIIDTSKIPLARIDFTPTRNPQVMMKPKGLFARMPRIQSIVNAITFQDRNVIGSSADTGHLIYTRFMGKKKYRFESPTPVYKLPDDFIGPKYATSFMNTLLEHFLPDNKCFIPKRKDYFTQNGFKEYGFPDIRKFGFEEFIWQGKPYGFHLRRASRDNRKVDDDVTVVTPLLKTVLDIATFS